MRAFSEDGHPFATTWCDSPVVIPLAGEGPDRVVTPALGVSVARGAEVVDGTRGPAIRLNGVGSRAQVDFGQTLFHTQWLFSNVTAGDAVRVDAVIGSARQSITASSIRGALQSSETELGTGLVANAIEVPASTGEIDLFSGATGVLFTNEGDTPLEVIAAIGCPALEVQTEQLSPPVWDEASQRFLAEHRVTITNQLANRRLLAQRSVDPGTASSVVDDITVDLDLTSAGFSAVDVIDIVGEGELNARLSDAWNGTSDTALLANPLRLSDTSEQQFTFALAYEPDFTDPAWVNGVNVPEPRILVLGRVDSVQIGVSGTLGESLYGVDRSVSPNLLETPEPGIVLDLNEVEEPELTSAGRIRLHHEITLTNNGETVVEDLAIAYPLVELFGPGTVIELVQADGQGACAAPVSSAYDGDVVRTVLFDADGIGVGERCTVTLESLVIPGIQPTDAGTTYDAPLTVTARSGARTVRDIASLRTRLFQEASVDVELAEISVTNLEDGRHSVDGTINIANSGALDIAELAAVLDVFRPGTQDVLEPAPVLFSDFVGDESCFGAGATGGVSTSAFVTGGVSLARSSSCSVQFSFAAFPGQLTESWEVSVRVGAPVTAIQPELAATSASIVDFPEAPGIESSIDIESITNNADGTYTVRSVSTTTNTGDTPLINVRVTDTFAEVFGDQLLAHERIGDSCASASGTFPLRTASIAPDSNTCSVTTISIIRPGTDLDGARVDVDVVAVSTALVEVDANTESETISFSESPRLVSLVTVESVERVDEESVAFVLAGTVENTGDVDARNAQVTIDLDDAFALDSGDVPYQVQFLSVSGLVGHERFDGQIFSGVLSPEQTIPAGGQISFRLLVNAQPGGEPGPYRFGLYPGATSPAEADFSARSSADSTTVPLIRAVARSIEAENNNDGTYSITHSVTAENAGSERLSSIDVFTGFEREFSGILVGEVNVVSTCTDSVAAGEQCEVTRSATVRPGSAIGPYDVDVSIAATNNEAVQALVIPEPVSQVGGVFDTSALNFDEDPGVQVATVVGAFENNGDGTYTLEYNAEVTNTGDVPLYRVGLSNFVADTYGSAVVSDLVTADTCASVTFGNSLSPTVSCEQSRTATIRPLTNLGPWDPVVDVSADSPAFVLVEGSGSFESVTFTEDIAINVEASLTPGVNNGDGSYLPQHELVVTNDSDVPLVEVLGAAETAGFGDALLNVVLLADSCSIVAFDSPLLPGQECRVEQSQLVALGADLGPFDLSSTVSARSASGETAVVDASTNQVTFTESPEIELESSVLSIDSTGTGEFRVVMDLVVRNGGDVRLDDLDVQLDLDEVFPDIAYRIDGAVSDDFAVAEAFTAGEGTSLLAEGQSMAVGTEGTVFLVLAVEPGTDVGPFVGDLRAGGVSPAGESARSVVNVRLELPSVSIAYLAQSIDNNRDGSYTVTSSYEIRNDGTTDLEFVQLNEELSTIYAGTNVRLLAIDADGIAAADPEDLQRSNNLIEWGAGLKVGDSAILTSTVLVEPGNILGPFQPFVSVQGAAPTGTETFAEAVAANVVEFVEQPALRVEQRLAGRPVWDGDDFALTLEIDVINAGDVELRNVQIREDLLQALGGGSRISVSDIRSETLTVNSRFDGRGSLPNADGSPSTSTRDVGDTRLLGGGDTLAAGATASIEVDFVLRPETPGVYSTRAVVSARSPSGADLGASEEIEANTLTRLSVQGELGVAKQVVGDAILQPDGSIAVTYEILVENAGPFPLDNVTVHDRLSQSFGLGSSFETSPVRVVQGAPCNGFASPTYDGGALDAVLATGFELDPGERCRLQFDAVVMPSIAPPGPYRSSAFAIATDPFSGTVLDDSTDGTNSDPDGNQEPGDNDIATPVLLDIPLPSVEIGLESLPSGALDASGRFELQYLITIENSGAINVDSPRLLADLEAQWDTDFEVISVESDGLAVNESFDGSNETNVLDRAGELVAGEQYEVTLTARVEQLDSGPLDLDLEFDGVSITGLPVTSGLAGAVEAGGPNGAIQATLFDTLSVEEQRLLILGAAVISLFLLLFVRSTIRKVRWFNDDDDADVPAQPAQSALPVQSAQSALPAQLSSAPTYDGPYLDLREDAPDLDLRTSEDRRGDEHPRPAAPVIDLTSASDPDRHRDERHHARRRQRRRPLRQPD